VLHDQGKLAEAETYFQESLDKNRRLNGEEHPTTLTAILRMASLRVAQGKHDEAGALLTPIQDKVPQVVPGTTALLRQAAPRGLLGKARAGLASQPADYAAAEADLLEAHAVFAKRRGEEDKETRDWVQGLVDLYTAWDRADPGQGYAAKAEAWRVMLQPA